MSGQYEHEGNVLFDAFSWDLDLFTRSKALVEDPKEWMEKVLDDVLVKVKEEGHLTFDDHRPGFRSCRAALTRMKKELLSEAAIKRNDKLRAKGLQHHPFI